jgi:hypothetical protein
MARQNGPRRSRIALRGSLTLSNTGSLLPPRLRPLPLGQSRACAPIPGKTSFYQPTYHPGLFRLGNGVCGKVDGRRFSLARKLPEATRLSGKALESPLPERRFRG